MVGAPAPTLHRHLEHMARSDFSEKIEVPVGAENSVLASLQLAQNSLANLEEYRQMLETTHQRLSQFYAVLSQCNQAIVRSRSEAELFQQICHDSVGYHGICMAWIGLVDATGQRIIPIIAAGEATDILFEQVFSLAPQGLESTTLFLSSVRQAKAQWCQDLAIAYPHKKWNSDSDHVAWKSAASLPLFKNNVVYGSLNLYARTISEFDTQVQALLIEMAMDISFALNRFELEAGRQRSRRMEALRSFMLEKINSTYVLDHFFREVTLYLESIIPHSLCTIVLLDKSGSHCKVAAAASLPDFFTTAIDGLAIGEGVGSCGHTMYSGTRTIVDDIATHPYWRNFKILAESAGLAACWSQPIRASNNQILGAFAVYHPSPTKPESAQLQLLEMSAHFLSIAIERERAEVSLRKLSQAVEQSPNIIIITDTDAHIEYVNAAFIAKTGQTLVQVQGKRPSVLQSDRNPLFTYEEIWDKLRHGESWQGELVNRYMDGEEYTELAHISPVRDADGKVTHFLSVQEDISDKKRTEERIQYLAHYDVLTGLPNRVLLEERAHISLAAAKRKSIPLTLMFFDLDHFKNINDSLGHSIGDNLLAELANRLLATLREGDTISRLGGDEFILVLPGVDELGAEHVAEKLLRTLSQSYQFGQYDLNVSASIGIAIFPQDGEDLETLLRNADTAMYRAKKDGRNQFRFFTQDMQARSGRHLQLVNALRYALQRNQLQVVYQPQISMEDERVIGTEALLRWRHPELGLVSPAEFIPVAEETGMILPIGEWVLRCAVQQTKEWQEQGWSGLGVAVNLSTVQFRHAELPDTVSHILSEAQLDPKYLELELTEGVAMNDPAGAIVIMNLLDARGIKMSIDDFGTGYSSLSYLKRFKVGKLKIDQSFVRDIDTDPEDKAIVSAVISMAKSLGLQTIAEGVETEQQLSFLRERGCDEAQGYYFSKPLTPAQFETFMSNRQIENAQEV
ncbi:MAG: EAL domain-containing protein [Undibacterium sp.]|nr:EAL domain-containing protein [Undibacterium sp.]